MDSQAAKVATAETRAARIAMGPSALLGGRGGQGGRGASGGGGLGGHSIGIAASGGAMPAQTLVTVIVGGGGTGGLGGDGDTSANVIGASGAACKVLAFDTMTCSN